MSATAPDMVSLQEVDCRKSRTGKVDQLRELARLTAMQGIFGCAIDSQQDGQYGNAVLSRLPANGGPAIAARMYLWDIVPTSP